MGRESQSQPGEPDRHAVDEAAEVEPATNGRHERSSFDIARDSDVPISTQLYWQLAYQIDTGRLAAGTRLQTVRELGLALHINPNTVRAVYKRLADNGYVVARQGAGTRVAARAPQRQGSGTLEGMVAELLRSAARAGYSADEVASAVYAAASERKRPGARVHVLFVECTSADARRAAERIEESFPGEVECDGILIDRAPERLDKFHYDIVATSTFHADETIAIVEGRAPVVALLAAPSYAEMLDEIRSLPDGSVVGLVCANRRSTANIAAWIAEAGAAEISLADRALRRRRGDGGRRPEGRPPPPHARGARDRDGGALRAAGADPGVDVRPRRRRAGTPPAVDSAGAGGARSGSRQRSGSSGWWPRFEPGRPVADRVVRLSRAGSAGATGSGAPRRRSRPPACARASNPGVSP